jgi:large subunit ribosomal protein L5
MTRLQEKYRDEVIPALRDRLEVSNDLAVPRLEKIIISMGVGEAIVDNKRLDEAVGHLTTLSGQKPQITRARRSVAGFKLREGMPIGCRVTLRRQRMWEFLDRLISLVLPRVRDFRGLNPRSFDGRGNYSLGLTEQMVFPEINPDSVHHTQGMNITLVTSAETNDAGRELLRELGMPFQKEDED